MQQDPLSELRDIHWPDPQGFWPLALGYYLVLITLMVICGLLFYYFLGAKKRKIKRALWQEFLLIEQQFLSDQDVALLQAHLSALLKRVVFYKYGEKFKRATELSAMEEALKKMMPSKKTAELLKLLTTERFYKSPSIDKNLLLNLAREQIKRCRI